MDTFRELENRFNYTTAMGWCQDNWHLSIYAATLYVTIIFGLQWLMTDRKPYDLRRWLFGWSLSLALFSLMGFYHTGIPFVQRILQNGWFASVCKIDPQTDWEEDLPIFTNVWAILFAFSKILEFGDTIFIVLRKQKLIFLHWYHHTTVTLYVWFFFANSTSTFLWHMAMNYFMHTFMYSYYAIRAIGSYRPPKWINMTLTSMQLIQMVVGIFINSYVLLNALMDHTFYCDGRVEVNLANPILAVALYTSYLILFATFFWSTYLKPNKAAGKMGQGIDEEIKERSPVLLEQNMKKQSSDKEQQEEIFLKKDDDSPNNGNHLPFSEVELFRRFSQVKFT